MFRCVVSALLLVVSPITSRACAAAADESPKLWEDDKLTEVQPFPAKVRAVESSWGGYRLLLESAGEAGGEGKGEKRYCFAQVWPGGSPHLEYREIRKADLPKPGPTMVYLDPAVAVSRFSWSMGPWRIGRVFGEEDCVRKVVAMEVEAGRGNGTGKFIGLPEKAEAEPTSALPEGAVVHSVDGGETDPVKLKAIYERYTGAKFADIAHELAREWGENPDFLTGVITEEQAATPWGHNLAFTLQHAWDFHMKKEKAAADKQSERATFEVLMSVLEDAKVGIGRIHALFEIKERLEGAQLYGKSDDGSMPPVEETMRRLRAIAANEGEKDLMLRRQAVEVIYQYGDPNGVLDLAIELASRSADPFREADAFYQMTPSDAAMELTKENRAKFLKHGFLLLGRINDGKSGSGRYLAEHLGWVIGIEPVREGQSPFEPDQRLPEYRGKDGGLTEAYFQKPVEAAMAWWEEHRGEYE